MKIKGSLPVSRLVAGIAAVVDYLAVALAVALDEDIAINEGFAVERVAVKGRRTAVHKVELAVAIFYPVVADDCSGGAVFEVIAGASVAQRPEMIELEEDSESLGVVVVLVDAPLVAVAVNRTILDDDVRRRIRAEEAVAAVGELAVSKDDVISALDEDCRGVAGVALGVAAVIDEGVWRSGFANRQVFDDDILGSIGGGETCAADFDYSANLAPIVEFEAGGGVFAVDNGKIAADRRNSANDYGRRGCSRAVDDPLFPVGSASPMD